MVVFADEAKKHDFFEYNVALDKKAYIRIMNKIPNIYWVPCLDGGLWKNNGNASFWQAKQSVLLKDASKQLINYFLYALSESDDTLGYTFYLHKSVNENDLHKYILDDKIPLRSLWCCSVFPYFVINDKNAFPLTFENASVKVDNNAELQYSDNRNRMFRFKITDQANYSKRMTGIYNSLIKQLK